MNPIYEDHDAIPPPLTSNDEVKVENVINRAAKEKLNSASSIETQAKSSSLWSWFSWGKKGDQPPKEEKKESAPDEEKGILQEPLGEDKQLPADKRVQFDAISAKTVRIGKSWWKSASEKIVVKAQEFTTKGVHQYAAYYGSRIDREKSVAEAKAKMDCLHDPMFLEGYEAVKTLLLRNFENKINELQDGFLKQNIIEQKTLVQDLLEINLARGFANLAECVSAQHASIPNYENQSSLINVLSYLCQCGGRHISLERLTEIANKHREKREKLSKLTEKLFPDIKNEPKKQSLIEKYIEYTDSDRIKAVKYALFPDIDQAMGERSEDISEFNTICYSLRKRKDLAQLFDQVTDDILEVLFPSKFADMEVPGILQFAPVQSFIFDYIHSSLTKVLQDSYRPLENDLTRGQNWENDLKTRTGVPDVQPFVQAPAALLTTLINNYIQSDPRVVGLTAWGIVNTLNPQASSEVDEEKRKQIISQLSQQKLANWIVEAVQSMLFTQDPHLLGVGHFIQQCLNQLTLALMAKGAKLTIPEGEMVEDNQYIKELSDRIVKKFQSLQNQEGVEAIPDDFWKEFVKELPLPPMVKDLLVPILIEKGQSFQKQLKEAGSSLEEIQKIYSDSKAKILNYANGDKLLAITEKLSDRIVEQALQQNGGLASSLGDTIDELFAQYLPGIKINEDLKNWFKGNLSALGASKDQEPPQTAVLLKEGIHAVLCKAMVNTIETTFKGNGKDYAAQLLKGIQEAFENAIDGFDDGQRAELDKALLVIKEIKSKENQIQELKEQISRKPVEIAPEELSLIEEQLNANIRHLHALDYRDGLLKQRDEKLAKLNQNYVAPWKIEDVSAISDALTLYKMEISPSVTLQNYVAALRGRVEKLLQDQESADSTAIHNEIDQRKRLLDLFGLSADELQLFSDILDIEATIKHAETELQERKEDFETKKSAIDNYDKQLLANRQNWDKAKLWLDEALENRRKIFPLTKELETLQKQLDTHLALFQTLSQELTALLGLGDKEKLNLPSYVSDRIWPTMESAKKEQIPRVLFEQIVPILLPALDADKNKRKILQFSQDNPFLVQLAQGVSKEVISRIPDVIDPKKIAHILSDYIPGGEELHNLIEPQLKDVVSGNDPAFQKNRKHLQNAIEGIILKLFVKIAEANQVQDQNILDVLTRKLKDLALNAKPIEGKSTEEIARKMIDKALKEIFAIVSEDDLVGIPLGLQKMCYEKLKEEAYQSLTPLLIPIIERNQNRAQLEELSGSKFMGSLCTAFSHDLLFNLVPTVAHPNEIAATVSKELHFDENLQQALANELLGFIQGSNTIYQNTSEFVGSYIEGVLLKIFIKMAQKNRAENDKDTLVVITKKLLDLTTQKYKEMKGQPPKVFAKGIYDTVFKDVFGIDSPDAFEGLPDPLKVKIHNVLEERFIDMIMRIQEGLSTLETENEQVQQARKRDVENFKIAKGTQVGHIQLLANDLANFVDAIIPGYLTEMGGEKMRGVNLISKNVESIVEDLARGNLEFAKLLLDYAQAPQFQEILAENLSSATGPDALAEERKKAVQLMGNFFLVPLNRALDRVVEFEKKQGAEFTQKLMTNILRVAAEHLKHLNEAKNEAALDGRSQILHQDFIKATGDSLHPGVPKAPVTYQNSIDAIEKRIYGGLTVEQKARWVQEKETLRQAIDKMVKEEAKGNKVISLQDIMDAVDAINQKVMGIRLTEGQKLALSKPDEKRLNLKDLIRQEAEAHTRQRQEEAYIPASKAVLKMLFPNGKKDLTFVPEELRGQTWKIFKKNLFPQLLPILTELLLDPDNINSLVLSSLESMKESLSGEIPVEPAKPVDQSLNELDKASGALIAESLKLAKLPGWMKKLVVDTKTNEISPAMQKTMGEILRKQLTGKFIKDKIQWALEKAVKRDEKGDYLFKYEAKTPAEIEAKAKAKQASRNKMQNDLKRESHEVVDVSISYFIRSQWIQAQARFDRLVERTLGKPGTALKKALDAVFGFIFFKIIGAFLSLLFSPIKGLAKEALYKLISLDENRKTIMGLLGRAPEDQPATSGYVVYNENLVYKLGQVLKKTVDEVLEEPLLPHAE